MLEIAQNFEQMTATLSPVVLIAPGLAAVIVGLFVWLGGLGLRRLLVAVVGAVGGGICGFFIIGRNTMSAMISAGVAAVIAIIFEKFFITILAAALAAALGLAILAGPYIENPQEPIQNYYPFNQEKISYRGPYISVHESIHIVKAYIVDFSDRIKQACLQMPVYNWIIIAALAAIFITGGFLLWRLTSALCCATLGTLLVFAGMILLLLYKGAEPISSISRRTLFYAAVFIAMIVFGTIEQLLLCPWLKSKAIRRKEAKKDKQRRDETTPHWRTT